MVWSAENPHQGRPRRPSSKGDHIRRYCHVGTGNYNPKTARLYTDLGLLTGRDDIGADITDLFNYLTGYSPAKFLSQAAGSAPKFAATAHLFNRWRS